MDQRPTVRAETIELVEENIDLCFLNLDEAMIFF